MLSDASLIILYTTGIKTDRDRIPLIYHVLFVVQNFEYYVTMQHACNYNNM